jgi:ABC-2 type transport system permease protein
MRPYLAIVGARFRMLLQYRAAAIAGVWTQVFFGLVLIMVYEAFYAGGAPQPIALPQLASYVWLGQALLAMLPWNTDPEWRELIRKGAIAYELCRPVDLYALWYARTLARRSAPTLLRAAPMIVFAAVVLPAVGLDEWRLAAPPSFAAGLAFAAAVVGALALGCALSVLVNLTALWTIAGDGLAVLLTTAVTTLSGMLIPLPLFPDAAQTVLAWLPFAGLVDVPFRIYTGHLPLADVPLALGRQLGWTIALVAFGRWLLGRGLRRVVVQGG